MSPVYSTAFERDGHTLGYIRLVNFSQHAAADMRKAITRLQVKRRPPLTACKPGLGWQCCCVKDFQVVMLSADRCIASLPRCLSSLVVLMPAQGPTHASVPRCCLRQEGPGHSRCLLQGEGAEGYILDLRSNPGGLVRAGLDVARLWLDGDDVPVFNVRSPLPSRVIITQRPPSVCCVTQTGSSRL